VCPTRKRIEIMIDKADVLVSQVVEQIQDHLGSATLIALSDGREYREPLSPVNCNDGTVLSIQAGASLYSTPRNNAGPWTHVEVMVISSDSTPQNFSVSSDGVGAFISVEDVAREILYRGGIDHEWS
jgi:hypothetical protein